MSSHEISLRQFKVRDPFWENEMELVRKEVIPYQWDMLNDRVEGAEKSYCMRNFATAGKMMAKKKVQGAAYAEPKYTFRGFQALPEDPDHPEDDKFYGFVFQDSDFSKWIEAVAYSLTNHPDPELEKLADGAIDVVCSAQLENGYLDTYYIIGGMDKAFTNLRDHHELYCFGHLVEGAVAYYQATGKDKLLNAAKRFADLLCEKFGPAEGQCKGYPGHEIAEMALVRLYEVTGEEKYLNLSRFFIDERGQKPNYFAEIEEHDNFTNTAYHQAHLPVREQKEATGHAVRAVYLYSGMADIARITGDQALVDACKALWFNVTKQQMYITGGIGSTPNGEAFTFAYDLPNDINYSETCASIGLMFWARRMLELEADADYADVMEQALYNTVLAGMALDGKSFFYVNPLEVYPEACHRDERKHHVRPVRPKWFGCACCPPNLARLISSLPSYAYTETEDTLFVHLYLGGDLETTKNGKKAAFAVDSSYPASGAVTFRYTGEEANFTLALRIPGTSETSKDRLYYALGSEGREDGSYAITLPEGINQKMEKGYLYLSGTFAPGMEIALDLPIRTAFYQADKRVRSDIGKLALMRGPVVYTLEEVDNGKDLHLLRVDPSAPLKESTFTIGGKDYPALIAQGFREDTPCQLTYIPYYTWANRGENEMMVWIRK